MSKTKALNLVVMLLLIGPLWIVSLLQNLPWHSRPDTIVIAPQGSSQTVRWLFEDQEQAIVFAEMSAPVISKLGGSVPMREGNTVRVRLPGQRTEEGSLLISLPMELVPSRETWVMRLRLSPHHVWTGPASATSLQALGYLLVEGHTGDTLEVMLSIGFLPTALAYLGCWLVISFLCSVALALWAKTARGEDRRALIMTLSGLSQVPAMLGLALSNLNGIFEALSIQFGTVLAGMLLIAAVVPVIMAGIIPFRRLSGEPSRSESWSSRSLSLILQATPLVLFLAIRLTVDRPLSWLAATLSLGTWGVVASEILVYGLAIMITPDRLLKELTLDELRAVLAHEKGHIFHWHLVKLQAIYLSTILSIRMAIGMGASETSGAWITGLSGLIALPLAILITLHWSKVFEFQADRFAATSLAAEGATFMSNALKRLHELNGGESLPDVLLSHPPIQARLRELQMLQAPTS